MARIVIGNSHICIANAPEVKTFFDPATSSASHVVRDPRSSACAIIDPVLDFDMASGRTATRSAAALVQYVRDAGLQVQWLLETHAHADHLSAALWLQQQVGGQLAIGAHITHVQEAFGNIFNAGTDFSRDGSQFDHLFVDGEAFAIGHLQAVALHGPGHTPACMAYVIGDAVFPGDTLFMPDYGTARCDFPGGSARQLYRSIHRLLDLPDDTRVFVCHDYKATGRAYFAWETTIGAQRSANVHVHQGVSEAEFVEMRERRDATLPLPRLLFPSVQVNMRAGHLPTPESNDVRYLKLPLDLL
ncbi:MBL fold metallo-hydrolase [Xanthomonas cissicola]|uniref:MBL fold metallo-hydrolase n=1 Tax=Xanthomonas cissicola TaxID=86186 RepID=A0ABX3M437_9XANT|nr:MBL fold metallo-hydrolase [Xanthomonas cissicola]OOW74728.1 MBL fold metallo-hydrolase [Xanthomonas cissicola]